MRDVYGRFEKLRFFHKKKYFGNKEYSLLLSVKLYKWANEVLMVKLHTINNRCLYYTNLSLNFDKCGQQVQYKISIFRFNDERREMY